MGIQANGIHAASSVMAHRPSQRQVLAGGRAVAAAAAATASDRASISQAARDRMTEAFNDGQWRAALDNRRTGVPQLVKVDAALAGGKADVQGRLQQLLAGHAVDPDAGFTLTHDAASRSFRVDGAPAAKAAVEVELNGAPPSAAGAAIREGYFLLSDMANGLAAVREQHARDRVVGGNDTASRQRGHADGFSIEMRAGMLSFRVGA